MFNILISTYQMVLELLLEPEECKEIKEIKMRCEE